MTISKFGRPLVVAGALLFLVGLLQGGTVQLFTNPRMGLSAHLTAVQSGMALMIAGLIWPGVSLSGLLAAIARSTLIAGMYGLWLGLTLSAATGASETLPIVGVGFSADAATEKIVSAFVLGGSILMTIGWLLVVLGLVKPANLEA